MKRLLCLLLLGANGQAHVAGRKDLKPSKAAPELKRARAQMDSAKRALGGKYSCCAKPSCDICARRHGSCACAANLAKGAGVCGQCQSWWKAKGKSHPLLSSDKQKWGNTAALTPELEEAIATMLSAKRTLVQEKRYACCVRGGCDECAHEGECPCGGELAKPPATSQGVCGSCLDGWHAGEGSYPGVTLAELKLAPMEDMAGGMMGGMSPNVPASGWYTSGTSQTPRASPMFMTDRRAGSWTLMAMGQLHLLYTAQSGPRGGDKLFSTNWLMPMASRRLGRGTLTLRSMFSLEPATVTQGRYPLLFQTGETYGGGRPIVDGQHPHSFLMELGAAYSLPVAESTSVNFYGGARGEPAFGPGAYAHRLSQSENPLAVLAHHYQDSTHIAGNVVTTGFTHKWLTLEGSGFLGREPGEARWQLEKGGIDSWSSRVTVTPTANLAAQFSYASITAPEATEPDSQATRLSGSITYVRPHSQGHWASTLLWGRNHKLPHDGKPGAKFNSYLAESTIRLRTRHWLWTRFELTDKDSRLALRDSEDPIGRVRAITAGYSRELPGIRTAPWLSFALGGQFTAYFAPPALEPFYGGRNPVGAQIFLRARLVPGR
jgi:hypothetical protein